MKPIPRLNIRQMYDLFGMPVTAVDCGEFCAPHNPSGKPFCCDICQAVPAAYRQEWDYLKNNTDLWHIWLGTECPGDDTDPIGLIEDTPDYMLLLACKGPAECQRAYRALSCRQFPFFPYITTTGDFIGLAYDWAFEPHCWVISNLGCVTDAYREAFVQTYNRLFESVPDDMESYAIYSGQMREYFAGRRRRIPLLHRDGGFYLVSPGSERLQSISVDRLKKFGPYNDSHQEGG